MKKLNGKPKGKKFAQCLDSSTGEVGSKTDVVLSVDTSGQSLAPLTVQNDDVITKSEFTEASLLEWARACLMFEKRYSQSYLNLCKYIRVHRNFLAPVILTSLLSKAGFHRVRISEIKRVCYVSDEIFSDFEQGLIGWRPLLARAREADQKTDKELKQARRWNKWSAEFERLVYGAPGQMPPTVKMGPNYCLLALPNSCLVSQEEGNKIFSHEGFRVTIVREKLTQKRAKKPTTKTQ